MPCFLWIFLGAPYVERLRHHRPLAGALAAITAAVVGVVLNLALWFARHVLFRQHERLQHGIAWIDAPRIESIDPAAASLTVAAAVAMFWFRADMLATLGGYAVAGVVIRMVGG